MTEIEEGSEQSKAFTKVLGATRCQEKSWSFSHLESKNLPVTLFQTKR